MLERFLAGALDAYMPRLAKMREERAAELAQIKSDPDKPGRSGSVV